MLDHGRNLLLTYQALANKLGTVRGIILWLLDCFEREDWMELACEHICDSALPA